MAVVAPLVYLACSIWLFFPLVRHLRSAQMGGADTSLFTWWLGWIPYAIGHGINPLVSNVANAPGGLNAMWNTSVPLLGVVMWPVTTIWGPIATVNLLLVLAPAVSAWGGFLGARLLGLRQRSSFLAGFLYGFSTYLLAQDGTGHLHLSMAPFPPLVAALLYRIAAGRTPCRRGGLLLGLAGALQLWVGEEILATSVVVTAVSLVVLAIWDRGRALRVTAERLLRTTAWAMLVALPLALPALLIQLFGRGHLSAGVHIPLLSSDLLTAVTPTRQVLAHWLVPGWTMTRIQTGYAGETTGYVGLPAVLLLAVCRRWIRTSELRWCWAPLLVAAALTIGWSVRVAGHPLGLPGPARLLRLPLLSSIVAPRFSLYTALFAALLVAAAWDAAPVTVRAQRSTAAAVALVVLAVLPWPSATITRVTSPVAFTSKQALPGTADGATVAVLPWPTSLDNSAMRWQAINGFHFRLLGAYGIVAGKDGGGAYGTPRPTIDRLAQRFSGQFDVPKDRSAEQTQEAADLVMIGRSASALVIGDTGHPRDQAAVAAYIAGLLHQQPVHTGGVYVFRLGIGGRAGRPSP